MPDTFAYVAILGWPLVVVVLFQVLSVPKALASSIIAGYLLLPSEAAYNLPMLPPYGKDLAASLPALLMALAKTAGANGSRPAHAGAQTEEVHVLPGWMPKTVVLTLCLLTLICSPFLTAMMNGDTIFTPAKVLPGLSAYDAASGVLSGSMLLIPFFLARKYLAHPREHAMLLGLLCLAGLAYSLPALYEVRMSPQLNNMIYGFFPHSWLQHMRSGGYRPLVFLEHGLRLGIFLAICFLATFGAMRERKASERLPYWAAALWLLLTLVLSKNLGATIVAVLFVPLILLASARLQILLAAVVAGFVLVYPMMRGAGMVPTGSIISAVSSISGPGRVMSLEFRFRNEDILLDKANDRPLFGWGGWGRGRVYDDKGRNLTVTDGTWIIIFGNNGWIGYLSQFGLLTLPIVFLAFRGRDQVTLPSAALCLILSANLIDLIPNSGLTSITWLLAGAVVGRLEVKRAEDAPEPDAPAQPRQASPYRRNLSKGAGAQAAPSFRRGGAPASTARPTATPINGRISR